MVYRKDCTVMVYKTGQDKTPVETYEKCDGEEMVRKGPNLFLDRRPVVEERGSDLC